MRYTKDDYQHVVAILTGRGASASTLAPLERRILDAVRIAYVMQADVPLAEAKIARQVIHTARGAAAQQLTS